MWMSKAIAEAIKKLAESPGSLLILVGAAVFVIGVSGSVPYVPISQPYGQSAGAIVGALLAFVGVYLVFRTPTTSNNNPFGISITSPINGAAVPGKVDVTGTIKKHLPDDHHIWLMRIYGDRIVAIRRLFLEQPKDPWHAPQCEIWGPPGDWCNIGVYVVGPDGSALLKHVDELHSQHNRLMERLKVPDDTPDRWLPGIRDKTADMIECHHISVVRL